MILDPQDIERFIDAALAEDVGPGDVTTEAVVPGTARLSAELRAREPLVVAGLSIALGVFRRLAPETETAGVVPEGARAAANASLARLEGPARGLLTAERTALNIVQLLSGIATLTRAYADRIEGTGATLLDTRKTIPGLRALSKYATGLGGAMNHRMGLYDAVLIKDNHIAAAGGLKAAVAAARATGLGMIEVECDTLDQVAEALEAGATRVLLDNMAPDRLARAVALARGRAETEASGGITLESVRAVAETGVDFISVGRLTQGAPAVDIGLDVAAPGRG